MRAIVYNNGSPKCIEVPAPKAPRTKILVKIYAAGVNPVDAKYVFGDKLPNYGTMFESFAKWWVKDCIPGFDFSGVVHDIHPDMEMDPASAYQVGDKVYGTVPPFTGTFCEYQAVPLDQMAKMPDDISFGQAAAIPLVALTSLQCLEGNGVTSESHVLVIGATGGTGHVAVQYAKRVLHAKRVVGICSAKNIPWVKTNLGADHVIDYHGDWRKALLDEVQENGSFTHVFDSVFSASSKDQIMEYGKFIQCESHHSSSPSPLLKGKYITLGGHWTSWIAAGMKRVGGWNLFHKNTELFWIRFPQTSHELARITKLINSEKLQVHISHEFNFDEMNYSDPFNLLLERRTKGKIVIHIITEPETSAK